VIDKTLKLQSYSGEIKPAETKPAETKPAAPDKPADELALELKMKNAQIEEERSRSLEHLKVIVQLRESLKQEQAKAAEATKKAVELETRMKELAAQETAETAKKNAQLEEEKTKSLELAKTADQLREALKLEQAKAAEAAKKITEADAKLKENALLEARVKELNETLAKITAIAAMGKTG